MCYFFPCLSKHALTSPADQLLQPANGPIHGPPGHVHDNGRNRRPEGAAAVPLPPQAHRRRDELRLPHGSSHVPRFAFPRRRQVRQKPLSGFTCVLNRSILVKQTQENSRLEGRIGQVGSFDSSFFTWLKCCGKKNAGAWFRFYR